jgi:hypothetical protein
VENGRQEYKLASALRPLLPWLTAGLIIALLWTGWVMIGRYTESGDAERAAEQHKAKLDRELLDKLGGDKLTILAFYASPGAIHRGAHVSLCYGVSNAASVAIDPGLGAWKPALSRCLDVQPRRTTSYTLTAKSARGETLTANTKVMVQ